MNQKVNPAVAVAVTVVAILGLVFIGMKVMRGGGGSEGGSEGKAVVVRPSNPNDPKFTEHLPRGIAGGGFKGQ